MSIELARMRNQGGSHFRGIPLILFNKLMITYIFWST